MAKSLIYLALLTIFCACTNGETTTQQTLDKTPNSAPSQINKNYPDSVQEKINQIAREEKLLGFEAEQIYWERTLNIKLIDSTINTGVAIPEN